MVGAHTSALAVLAFKLAVQLAASMTRIYDTHTVHHTDAQIRHQHPSPAQLRPGAARARARARLGLGGAQRAAVVVLGLDASQALELGLLVEQQAAHARQLVAPPRRLLRAHRLRGARLLSRPPALRLCLVV